VLQTKKKIRRYYTTLQSLRWMRCEQSCLGRDSLKVMSRICLVSCSKTKLQQPAPAAKLYASTRFRLASAYARKEFDAWYVLSALHGLVAPNEIIAPYDRTLNGMARSQRQEWSKKVCDKIHEKTPANADIVILAGLRYYEFLVPLLSEYGYHVSVPLSHLGQGKQLQWLKRKVHGTI
jgi:hypothetical protein